jgi:diacylglycerol kinase family enzyme
VSNNAYLSDIAPGPALRPPLDEGMLWVYLVGLPGAHRPLPARLVRGTGRLVSDRALVAAWPTTQQTMTTGTASIPVGIDGEPAELETPLEFTVCPRALRLLQPSRNEPADRQFPLRW